jgi:anti-sigma B factor antagonist
VPDQPPGFAVATEDLGGRLHLVPRGELDLATAPELERVLTDRLSGETPVVLDLRELAFMDSTGVRSLVTARRLSADGGTELTIVRPDPSSPVSRVLDIAGIAEQLGMVDAP